MKELLQWPNWAILAILVAVSLNLVVHYVMLKRLDALFTKFCVPPIPYRNRDELEAAFTTGAITRAEYEHFKQKIS